MNESLTLVACNLSAMPRDEGIKVRNNTLIEFLLERMFTWEATLNTWSCKFQQPLPLSVHVKEGICVSKNHAEDKEIGEATKIVCGWTFHYFFCSKTLRSWKGRTGRKVKIWSVEFKWRGNEEPIYSSFACKCSQILIHRSPPSLFPMWVSIYSTSPSLLPGTHHFPHALCPPNHICSPN